jgi:hypothetical protein
MPSLLKTFAATFIASSNMVTTLAVKSDAILNHSLSMIEDVAANGHDYTSMARLTDMSRRRKEFLTDNADIASDIPPALQALLSLEIK